MDLLTKSENTSLYSFMEMKTTDRTGGGRSRLRSAAGDVIRAHSVATLSSATVKVTVTSAEGWDDAPWVKCTCWMKVPPSPTAGEESVCLML